MHVRRAIGGLVLGLGLAGAAATAAAAQTDRERVQVVYAVPDGCPGEPVFWERVTARTPSAERAGALADFAVAEVRTFAVFVARDGAAFEARLRVRDLDGTTSERLLTASTCDEAISALALVTALSIEERLAAAVAPAAISAPAIPTPAAASAPTPARRMPTLAAARPPASGARWRVALGVGGEVAFRRVGRASAGAAASLDLTRGSGSAAGPGARLALAWSPAGIVEADTQRARFTWWTARLDVCPLALGGARVRVRPCAALEAGLVTATGEEVAGARAATRPWLAPGASARLTLDLSAALSVEAGVALLAAVVRDRFHFANGATVLLTPAAQPVADAALVWTIP